MTTAIAVAAVLAFGFALGSLVRQADGPTLRRWRLSRRWDVSRLAREFIKVADEPLATVRGLMHMINAWERGARQPSERYWLLYLRVFPECVNGETANGSQKEAVELPGTAEINGVEAATVIPAQNADSADVRTLAAKVRALQQQIARLSKRVDELSRDKNDDGQPYEKARTGHLRWNGTPLWIALASSL